MYDIIFISYKEPNAEENFHNLKKRFDSVGVFGNRIKRVSDVQGIHNAHVVASKLATTSYFYVVDGDAIIDDNFYFDYTVDHWNKGTVHVWKSINPVNDLVYGYGGVKLLPTMLCRTMDTTTHDMTTSISSEFCVVDQISNVTAFNIDGFSTWRSAFRECAKLASKTIDRQNEDETNERLNTWTTVGQDRPYGKYALEGAAAGMEFGLSNKSDLSLINDFDWLEQKFKEA